MVKKLLATSLLIAATSSFAMGVTIGQKIKTINPKLFKHEQIELGYETTLTLSFNKNLYAQASMTKFHNYDRVGTSLLLGATTEIDGFSPYAEVSLDNTPTFDKTGTQKDTYRANFITQMNYDFGVGYTLTNRLRPFVEFDNPFRNQSLIVKPGINLLVTNHLGATVSYGWNSSTSDNFVEAGLTYAI
jgi:hypothetical protein